MKYFLCHTSAVDNQSGGSFSSDNPSLPSYFSFRFFSNATWILIDVWILRALIWLIPGEFLPVCTCCLGTFKKVFPTTVGDFDQKITFAFRTFKIIWFSPADKMTVFIGTSIIGFSRCRFFLLNFFYLAQRALHCKVFFKIHNMLFHRIIGSHIGGG